MKRSVFLFSMAVIAVLVFPSILLAAGNINFGNLKIIPSLEGQALFDDNIYYKNGTDTPTNRTNKKVSDMIYHVKPGLAMQYDIPERGSASLGWQGDWAFYNSETANNWKNNAVNLGVNYQAPAGLLLNIKNDFFIKEDPYGSPSQYALGRVTKRWVDDLKTKVGAAWGNNTFRTSLLYNRYQQQYVSNYDFSQNFVNSEYGAMAEARFLPKTWGFVRYLYGVRNFGSFYGAQVDGAFLAGVSDDRKADNKYNQVDVGLSWDPGSKLSGEFSVGYQWKKFDNQFDKNGNLRTDRDTWVAATSINYDATATTVLSLNIARTIRDVASDQRIYFEDTGVGLSVRQTILTKFFATAGFMMGWNEYNDKPISLDSTATATDNGRWNAGEKRSDRNYITNLGLDYQIREWLMLGVGYKNNRKTSNYEIFEFTDNQYWASLKIIY